MYYDKAHTMKRNYHCAVEGCNAKFTLRESLKNHSRKLHGTKSSCHTCDREFKDKFTLIKHKKTCLVKCHICNKTFNRKYNLKVHMKSAHDKSLTKSYHCEVDSCNKVFAGKHNLILHTKSVHENFIVNCHLCPSKFTRTDCFRRHLRLKHSDKISNLNQTPDDPLDSSDESIKVPPESSKPIFSYPTHIFIPHLYDQVFKRGISDFNNFINYIAGNRKRTTCKFKKYSNSEFKDILRYHFNQSRSDYVFLSNDEEEKLRQQIDDIDDIVSYLHRIENNCDEDQMMFNYFRDYCLNTGVDLSTPAFVLNNNLALPHNQPSKPDGNSKQQNSTLPEPKTAETEKSSLQKSRCSRDHKSSMAILEQVLNDFSSELETHHIEKIANCTVLTVDEIKEYINNKTR